MNDQNPMKNQPRNPSHAPAVAPTHDANRDPISGASGSHPVGVAVGSVGVGAAAGALGGAAAGPVGAAVGAVVGAVVGGLAGKAGAEAVDPTVEASYWRKNHASRPFAVETYTYEEFAPAYQYGWESFGRPHYQGKSFDSVEAELGRGWNHAKGTSRLGWDHAKAAAREAWDRVKNAGSALAGDAVTARGGETSAAKGGDCGTSCATEATGQRSGKGSSM